MYEVPKLSQVFNSFCNLLSYDIRMDGVTDEQALVEWENARQELATTIFSIAHQGIQEIKDQAATQEETMMYGRENAPPLLRLFKEGNRNLKAINNSSVPETLASLIAEENVDTLSLDTIISVIEAITAVTLYKPVAERVSELGVGKDLVRII